MEPGFWHERWEKGEIGFHQHDYNAHMQAFTDRLGLQAGARVLVPLCGKSLDMRWLLQQGYRVAGIEISRLAVEDFFAEAGLKFEQRSLGGAVVYSSQNLDIFCADFFNLQTRHLPPVDAVYDRASLIALPPETRPAYVRHMTRLTAPGTPTLLVSLDYPQREMHGPPFSVTPQEVEQLYGQWHRVERIHSQDCLAREPRFRKKGLSRLDEHVFLLQRRRGFSENPE